MWNKYRGFSLLELIIVVVIIGLLANLATGHYQQFILKTRRIDAKTSLLDYHAIIQRCFVTTHNYQECIIHLNLPKNSINGFYQIQTENFSAQSYSLQAIAQHQQQKDFNCYRFIVNQHQELFAYDQDNRQNKVCWTQ